jgi:hypothetical protein
VVVEAVAMTAVVVVVVVDRDSGAVVADTMAVAKAVEVDHAEEVGSAAEVSVMIAGVVVRAGDREVVTEDDLIHGIGSATKWRRRRE